MLHLSLLRIISLGLGQLLESAGIFLKLGLTWADLLQIRKALGRNSFRMSIIVRAKVLTTIMTAPYDFLDSGCRLTWSRRTLRAGNLLIHPIILLVVLMSYLVV